MPVFIFLTPWGQIDLDDFLSRPVSSIFDSGGDLYAVSGLFQPGSTDLKRGICKTEAKGIEDRFPKSVKIPVACIDILPIP